MPPPAAGASPRPSQRRPEGGRTALARFPALSSVHARPRTKSRRNPGLLWTDGPDGLAGPANAGKVALLLDRYLADLRREPVLIVPTGSDVERVERDLLARAGALLGGSIGTFDDVFEQLAAGERCGAAGRERRPARRSSCAASSRRARLERARPRPRASAASPTRSAAAIGELEAGLLEPDDVDGDLAALYGAYRAELDRLGLWDRDLRRAYAAEPRRRRPRRLGRSARLRVRLRGPDRARSGACSRRSPDGST